VEHVVAAGDAPEGQPAQRRRVVRFQVGQGLGRKAHEALLAAEALLLHRQDDLAVLEQADGRADADLDRQDVHGMSSGACVARAGARGHGWV